MSFLARAMPETATYWRRRRRSASGQQTYDKPRRIKVRQQDQARRHLAAQGAEDESRPMYYTTARLEVGGRIALGFQFHDVPPASSDEIEDVRRSPSLSGREVLYKVMT